MHKNSKDWYTIHKPNQYKGEKLKLTKEEIDRIKNQRDKKFLKNQETVLYNCMKINLKFCIQFFSRKIEFNKPDSRKDKMPK